VPVEEISMWDWYGMHMGLDLFFCLDTTSRMCGHTVTRHTQHMPGCCQCCYDPLPALLRSVGFVVPLF
jgi:hypothetical protein